MQQRILVVDDEDAIAEAVIVALSREGFACEHVSTIAAARARIAGADLLVLDIGLPDGSGLDVLKDIQASDGPPVLLLSARGEELDRVLGLELGADDYVVKPFSPRELASRVKVILRRSNRQQVVSSAAPFAVDEAAQRIRFRGQALELTRQEFRLLQILIEQAGCVLSRSRLLDLAWDDPGSCVDRAVDTTVKCIRAKLREIDEQSDPIRTVRGEGYCLDTP